MTIGTLELLKGLTGTIALGGWIAKYYMHFNYRKVWDPALKNVSFGTFLSTGGKFTSLKLAFCIPWISRNKQAEQAIPGLEKKGKTILMFCFSFILVFAVIMALSEYEKAHFPKPDEI